MTLHYRFRLHHHPDNPNDRILFFGSLEDPNSGMPIPVSEEDIIGLHGLLERELGRRRAYDVRPDGSLQRYLPP